MKTSTLLMTSFATLTFSSLTFAAAVKAQPANACQAKAMQAATAALANEGHLAPQFYQIEQNERAILMATYNDDMISAANPVGQVEVTVGIQDFDGADCSTTFVTVDPANSNG